MIKFSGLKPVNVSLVECSTNAVLSEISSCSKINSASNYVPQIVAIKFSCLKKDNKQGKVHADTANSELITNPSQVN